MTEMYEWVKGTTNPLAGECPHRCTYCYVKALQKAYPPLRQKYVGPPHTKKIMLSPSTKGKYFLCSCNDLFAAPIPEEMIKNILSDALRYGGITWVLQSKNPKRMMRLTSHLGGRIIRGTTIETNRSLADISKAPPTIERTISGLDFVTIEPIMDFDIRELSDMLIMMRPRWINIGADSKHNNLREPTATKIVSLIANIGAAGIEIRQKTNLKRLIG